MKRENGFGLRMWLSVCGLALLAMTGCGGGEQPPAAGSGNEPPKPVVLGQERAAGHESEEPEDDAMAGVLAPPTPTRDPETVVATIDGEPVPQKELDREIDMLLRQMGQGRVPVAALSQFRSQMEPQALRRVALKRKIAVYAAEHGLSVAPEEVQAEIDKIASQFPSEEAFKRAIEQAGMSEETLRKDAADSVLMREAANHYMASLPQPSSDELTVYYEQNLERYTDPESIEARHIMVGVPPDATAETWAAKHEEAKAIHAELVAGASFDEVAERVHARSQANRGGPLGQLSRGQGLPQEFEDAAFALDAGEFSDVIKTQFGYHIISVDVHDATRTDALADIESKVREDYHEPAIASWLEQLVSTAKIEPATSL